MDGVVQAIDKVAKKQRTDTVSKQIDGMLALLQGWQHDGASSDEGQHLAIQQLREELQAVDVQKAVQTHYKELLSGASKLGKAIDKAAPPSLEPALPSTNLDGNLMMEALCQHLLSVGQFDTVEQLQRHNVANDACRRLFEPLREMHAVREALLAHQVQPAIDWADRHAEQLRRSSSTLPFMLRQLQFLQLLHAGTLSDAVAHVRRSIAPRVQAAAREMASEASASSSSAAVPQGAYAAAQRELRQLQRLMGSLAFAHRLPQSPYAGLLDASAWESVCDQFTRECRALLKLPSYPPLAECVDTGAVVLPTLLKLASVLDKKYYEAWHTKQLPIELDTGSRPPLHSIFSCPVSKEPTTPDNPPMMLPCGHVISLGSIAKLARGSRTVRFKCPYCPVESTTAMAKVLHLW